MVSRLVQRMVLPSVIGLFILFGSSGCVWIPTQEHPEVGEKQRDFSDMVGPTGSTKEIRPGGITRQQTIALLGEPEYASEDGNTIGYGITTVRSIWIGWFGLQSSDQRTYILRLHFANGVLRQPELFHWDDWGFPGLEFTPDPNQTYHGYIDVLVAELNNEGGPKLLPTDPTRRARFSKDPDFPSTRFTASE